MQYEIENAQEYVIVFYEKMCREIEVRESYKVFSFFFLFFEAIGELSSTLE